tara:strand:- start:6598 stop:7122 length:525 start_codon:yes stop_codon:yes gene_type:complete
MKTTLLALAVMASEFPPPPPPQTTIPAGIPEATRNVIFTYRVDGGCRVESPRLLQGPDRTLWRDADETFDITGESTVFRFVDGRRTQLRERRVRLLGELVREGELICHVRPSGEVVDAWIERRDDSVARRQAPRREPVPIRGGRVGDLGTFSVAFETMPADDDDALSPDSAERP